MGTLAASVLAMVVAVAATAPLPNIVFMLADDMGWNNVGWHSPIALTPNLNHLRATGVAMEHHYAQRWCAPTRAALMSGRYPHNVGMQFYNRQSGNQEERTAVPASFKFMPAVLKEAGYATHMLGKWCAAVSSCLFNKRCRHIGFFDHQYVPHGRGFDTSFGYMCGAESHDNRSSQVSHTCGDPVKDLYNTTHIANDSDYAFNNVYSAYMYADLASRLIKGHDKSKPFFLYMAFQDCHAPYSSPQVYQDMFPNLPKGKSQQCYNSMVTALDDAVGNITRALIEANMMNNTVIVWSSDNGGPARMANNMPLRGAKFGVFEGGVRVPAFVHSPLLPPATVGQSLQGVVHMTDWYATFAHLAGIDISSTGPVPPDGFNQWPALQAAGQPGQPIPRQQIIHEYDNISNIYAFRWGDWKVEFPVCVELKCCRGCTPLLPPHSTEDMDGDEPDYGEEVGDAAARVNDKVCTDSQPCLFNVAEDPTELHDLASTRPDMLAEIMRRFNESVVGRYMGTLDHSKVSEDDYCAWIKKVKWVQPYNSITDEE